VTTAEPHPESPVRIPLVREMLDDPSIALVARAVDCRWRYEKLFPVSVTGFNPLRYQVYYGRISRLARWLEQPLGPCRELNPRDQLVTEVLAAVHDYLHCWAVQAIRHLAPARGFGTRPLDRESLEAAAYCHLLTEAVATVGLDYWYLSIVDLNAVCDLGTAKSTLTTSYLERHAGEFRRADPRLAVQRPGFLVDLARFYATGVWNGIDARDVARSPLLRGWLEHEIRYGARGRELTRLWLAHLAPAPIEETEPARAVACDEPWQRDLAGAVAELLWDKVKRGRPVRFVEPEPPIWCGDATRPVDGRFVNLNRARGPAWARGREPAVWASAQLVASRRIDAVPDDARRAAVHHARLGDVHAVEHVLGAYPPLPVGAAEPSDLLVPN
jgi:hypothetical protein